MRLIKGKGRTLFCYRYRAPEAPSVHLQVLRFVQECVVEVRVTVPDGICQLDVESRPYFMRQRIDPRQVRNGLNYHLFVPECTKENPIDRSVS